MVAVCLPWFGIACGHSSVDSGSNAGSGGAAAGTAGQGGTGDARAGEGGAAGESARGGEGGVAGEGGSPAGICSCDDSGTDCTTALREFCPALLGLECPVELAPGELTSAICDGDAANGGSVYAECASGRVSFEWEGDEESYRLVFDADGELEYGRANGYARAMCQSSAPANYLTIEAGTRVDTSDCNRCDLCEGKRIAGEGGAGGGAGDESGSGGLAPCVVRADGTIELPE